MVISLFDDEGGWHTFTISNIWVIEACNRILYSQCVMKDLGVTHRLDDGYVEFSDGRRKRVSNRTYAVELTFGQPPRTALITSHPASRVAPNEQSRDTNSLNASGARTKRQRSATPQQLVWQRLGCPSVHVWTHVIDVLSDHGLPPLTHLKHECTTSRPLRRWQKRGPG